MILRPGETNGDYPQVLWTFTGYMELRQPRLGRHTTRWIPLPSDELAGYWKFDNEGQCAVVSDLSDNSNHLTVREPYNWNFAPLPKEASNV